ncbi:GNAT family N-acetyltransferase [Paenibacillus shenyangensis]|uniref:GNAT family N-acetyltransferase n=1 Tax=Paenibacillus sp. A9 TaxID=1284352 RepID=UPI0003768C6F|nr:GNAT family N-acetyltransferase [Paenibacillus sp. A9]
MTLTLNTYSAWDQTLWDQIRPIYTEAFIHGAKPEKILKAMLDRGIAFLHAGWDGDELVAMAVTGLSGPVETQNLIIDYMAIRQDQRGQGKGRAFFNQLRDWAVEQHHIHAVIIEAEAEDTAENWERIVFWEKCGFISTDYVHHYIWIPETYRALVLPIMPGLEINDDGQSLFKQITTFHEKSFRKSKA